MHSHTQATLIKVKQNLVSQLFLSFPLFLCRARKIAALAVTLQKASLQKKDLDLELEELEAAARMVAEDEEERGAFKSTSCSDSGSASSDSTGSSSDESEASEAEDEDAGYNEVGGGGGGEMSKDNPLQPQRCSTASPIPQEHTSTLLATRPSASEGCRQLIQELEERVEKELKLSQDCSNKAEGSCSRADNAVERTEGTSERSSSGNLLEPRNPLLILQTQEDL